MTIKARSEATGWRGRFRRLSGRPQAIVRELLHELRRLNRVGRSASGNDPTSHRAATRRVKALIARDYRDPNRCC